MCGRHVAATSSVAPNAVALRARWLRLHILSGTLHEWAGEVIPYIPYIHAYIHIHTHIYTYTHHKLYIHTHIHAHIYLHTYIHTIHTYIHTHALHGGEVHCSTGQLLCKSARPEWAIALQEVRCKARMGNCSARGESACVCMCACMKTTFLAWFSWVSLVFPGFSCNPLLSNPLWLSVITYLLSLCHTGPECSVCVEAWATRGSFPTSHRHALTRTLRSTRKPAFIDSRNQFPESPLPTRSRNRVSSGNSGQGSPSPSWYVVSPRGRDIERGPRTRWALRARWLRLHILSGTLHEWAGEGN